MPSSTDKMKGRSLGIQRPITPVELERSRKAASGSVNTEIKREDAKRLRAQGGNATDRMKARTVPAAAGRIAGFGGRIAIPSGPTGGPRKLGKRAFDL